jgi:hypothetical protein
MLSVVKLVNCINRTGADENAKIFSEVISLSPNDPAVYHETGTYSLSSGNALKHFLILKVYFLKKTERVCRELLLHISKWKIATMRLTLLLRHWN